jgi:hypothetical protein
VRLRSLQRSERRHRRASGICHATYQRRGEGFEPPTPYHRRDDFREAAALVRSATSPTSILASCPGSLSGSVSSILPLWGMPS